MNVRIVSAITRKDVVDAIRHRYLLTALVTPLFVALLFRVLLPGINSRSILTIVVHDSGASGLVAELRKTPQVGVVEAPSADATANEVERRKAIGGLVVPVNFDADVAASKQPALTVYVNNEKSSFEQAAFRRVLDQLVRSLVKQPEPARLAWVDVGKQTDGQTRGGAGLDQMLLPLLLILTFGMTGAFVVPLLLVEEVAHPCITVFPSSRRHGLTVGATAPLPSSTSPSVIRTVANPATGTCRLQMVRVLDWPGPLVPLPLRGSALRTSRGGESTKSRFPNL